MDREIYIPPQGPPQGPPLSPAIFQALGEEGFFAMARDFYAELEQSSIRGLFPPDMQEASKKLAMFLIPACGGPPLYQQAYGPPRMRARHMPFEIGQAEREVWLACFLKVLDEKREGYGFPEAELPAFKAFLSSFSAWMVNTRRAG